MNALERFMNYTKIDTQSDDNSRTAPSTKKQFDLAKLLINELEQLGIKKYELTNECIVYAWIDENDDGIDPIGLIAHMDTSNEASGKDVKPKIVHFTGEDILLNEENNIYLSKKDFPFMEKLINKNLVVTDGTTLLGADDKAGIAIIMETIKYIIEHPEIKHGKICIAFTPDEEVGRGVENFDVKKFGAKFGFTIDGGNPSDAEYETFNAASCEVKIEGRSVHPGSAKNLMINAALVGIEFNESLNNNQIPSKTEGYEGFHHLCDFEGTCEKASLFYILRNHSLDLLNKKIEEFKLAAKKINNKYNKEIISLKFQHSYKNMNEQIMKHPKIIKIAYEAIKSVGLNPISSPIRGGTDGANLSFKNLPCPNLGTGGYNYHGRFEFLCVEEFYQAIEIVKNIIILTAKEGKVIYEL